MSLYAGSRYANCDRLRKNGRPFLGIPERAEFTASKCTLYQVIAGDTIDGIAYKFYGNASYWWCIMDANREYSSELEIKAGDILQIPSIDEIRKVV